MILYEYARLTALWTETTNTTAFTIESAQGTRPLPDGGATHLQVLNLLGTDGWELIYQTAGPRPGASFATEYTFKRVVEQEQ